MEENLKFIRTERISYKKQKRQNTMSIILFIIGFIIPTITAILQKLRIETFDETSSTYFYIMLGLIAFDVLIYLPIFFINKSLVRKNNYKKLLLFLVATRKFGKLLLAIFSLMLVFYGKPEDVSFLTYASQNGLSTIFAVITALTSILSSSRKLTSQIASEYYGISKTVKKYSYDTGSNDIIVSVYKRQGKGHLLKYIKFGLFRDLIFILLLVVVLIVFISIL